MFDRLEVTKSKYEELLNSQGTPEVFNDLQKMTELQKEIKKLEPIYNKYIEYLNTSNDIETAKEMLNEPDLAQMGQEEIDFLKPKLETILSNLEILLLPKDDNDDKNIIVEIRGAAGGDEANIFAGDLFRMYNKYAETKGFKTEILGSTDGSSGGFSEIQFMIKGEGAYSIFKYESGAHRVQRVPQTETQGRVHTSTATVLIMPELEEVDFEINEGDIKTEVCRSSGAGGQSVNTTDSAVRMTHIPTGIVVYSQTERSQIKNREKAIKLLKSRVFEQMERERCEKIDTERKSKIGTGDRSEKIRTYNYPQNRLTDHRIGYTNMNLDRIIDGRMQDLIDALINEDIKLKLAGEND
ncbi:MAG: peptide chain release factor 1 [Bacilli bacterium]